MESEKIEIVLRRAPDDLAQRHPTYQAELNEFSSLLRAKGMTLSQRAITFDSADALGYPIGEFSLAVAGIVVPAAAHVLVAWIKKRPGRKITIKDGGVQVTAEKPEDAEHAFEQVMKLRSERLPKDRDE